MKNDIDPYFLQLLKEYEDGYAYLTEDKKMLIDNCFKLSKDLKALDIFKAIGDAEKCKQVELELSRYENFLDRKYWNAQALFVIISALGCGFADTVEEACIKYEIYRKPSVIN